MYDMRFYLQAIIDYFSSCKSELGVTDVHWSDDDPNGIAIVTKYGLITISGEHFPGLGDETKEDMEHCPVCGGSIDASEGEDNGYGELRLNWECEHCGSQGYAKIDTHNDNAFVGHEVDVEATDYHVSAAVDGHVNVFVKATGEELAKKRVDQVINEMDFGPLTSIDWEITDVCKA